MVTDYSQPLNDLYRDISSIPSVVNAEFTTVKEVGNKTHLGFNYTLSQRDFTRKTFRQFIHKDSAHVEAVSPCGLIKVALKHIDTESDTKPSRIHEEFYGDITFGCLSFSKSGHKVVYVAERKVDALKKDETSKSKSLVVDDESEYYDFDQDWGENFINRKRPNLFVIHLDQLFQSDFDGLRSTFDVSVDNIIKPIHLEFNEMDAFAPGQAIFSPKSHDIIYFTGYTKSPRKFGIYYCNNRPAFIYSVTIDGQQLKKISNPKFSARNPKFLLPDNAQALFYLQITIKGTYAASTRLIKIDLNQQKEYVLIETVQNHPTSFPGLYPDSLPDHAIKVQNRHFITIASQWRTRKVLLGINIDSNECQKDKISILSESFEEKGFVWSYLNAKDQFLLASKSAPNLPSELVLGRGFLNKTNQLEVRWTSIKKWGHDKKINGHAINDIKWEVFNFPERDQLECILVKALAPHPNMKQSSLLINIHGGPHAADTEMWNSSNMILSLLGFEILHVNYTGSTGYGDSYLSKLIGNIGDVEVKDCQYAMEQVWSRGNYHRKFVTGGSYGGFLTAHLIGQYPNYYEACSLFNPVINAGSMSFTADIPDWCFAETNIKYEFNRLPLTTPDNYDIMFKASPEQYVDKLTTPILLLLGSEDRRVPNNQGTQWCNHIRSRHPNLIKVKIIPNVGHPLDSIEAESISITQIGKHFLKFV